VEVVKAKEAVWNIPDGFFIENEQKEIYD